MVAGIERSIAVKRHSITLEEYDMMCEAGVFGPEDRVQLIMGEIIEMAPPGPDHEFAAFNLNRLFTRLIGDNALVWPQGNSIGIAATNSRPEPDITLLRYREDLYRTVRPTPEDVILLVEVSKRTLRFDKKKKLLMYANAGIPEYWVVNLVESIVEVYTQPASGKYLQVKVARRGEIVPLPGGLEGSVSVADLFV